MWHNLSSQQDVVRHTGKQMERTQHINITIEYSATASPIIVSVLYLDKYTFMNTHWWRTPGAEFARMSIHQTQLLNLSVGLAGYFCIAAYIYINLCSHSVIHLIISTIRHIAVCSLRSRNFSISVDALLFFLCEIGITYHSASHLARSVSLSQRSSK